MRFPAEVDKVGVELEGAFDWNGTDLEDSCEGDEAYYKEDGSVEVCPTDDLWVGECVSLPLSNWTSLASWVKEYHPLEVDQTCGTHVHISFKNVMDACKLVDDTAWYRQMYENLRNLEGLTTDEKYMLDERLRGNHYYCRDRWQPEGQLMGPSNDRYCSSRYTAVNWHSWHFHRTMEVRILPACNSAQSTLLCIEAVLKSLSFADIEFEGHEVEFEEPEPETPWIFTEEFDLDFLSNVDLRIDSRYITAQHGLGGYASRRTDEYESLSYSDTNW